MGLWHMQLYFEISIFKREAYHGASCWGKRGMGSQFSIFICKKHTRFHDEMTGEVFENWFKTRLLQNLPRDKKCVIVMDNASYHSKQAIKFPTLKSSVKDIINFMQYHKMPVPHPIPIKAAMMQTIRKANINKTYIVDELATSYGHEVLRLPPYHCVLNPIELVWARLKSHVRKNNTTPTLSASVCEHLREGVENINSNLWSSCVDHTIKVGNGTGYKTQQEMGNVSLWI
ncbi:hypothetical protein ANN_16095 [Periplaneta americana]|uniref:Tc1-like transposase DDE domain-containing protein n=1 Tax=Periplaneta americana TaxID=6978 RepID=A0ABQ8SI05_PERAM|nr:hypothetical protein ANN_16095 [Periplaneta americana]